MIPVVDTFETSDHDQWVPARGDTFGRIQYKIGINPYQPGGVLGPFNISAGPVDGFSNTRQHD
jgi:hypothetical protein